MRCNYILYLFALSSRSAVLVQSACVRKQVYCTWGKEALAIQRKQEFALSYSLVFAVARRKQL